MSILQIIWADLLRYKETCVLRNDIINTPKIVVESFIFKAGFQAVFLYRLSHYLHEKKFNYLAWLLTRFNQFFTSVGIEYNTEIGPGFLIAHAGDIIIGRGSKIGKNVIIYNGVTLGTKSLERIAYPIVEDNVIIFTGAKILGDITVGKNSIIGANSVVTKNVPKDSVVIGTRIKRKKKDDAKDRIFQA